MKIFSPLINLFKGIQRRVEPVSDDDIYDICCSGFNGDKDALTSLRDLSDSGNIIATGYLAVLLFRSHIFKDKIRAEILISRVIPRLRLAMYPSRHSEFIQGIYYAEVSERGVSGDHGRSLNAIKFLLLAANRGLEMAQNALGLSYQYGSGVIENKEEAVVWYLKAACQGFSGAQNNLGYCYEHAEGIALDATEAVKWYSLSSQQGYALAQANLGYCHQYGIGLPVNHKEAVRLFRLAAEQGLPNAQNDLGNPYIRHKLPDGIFKKNATFIGRLFSTILGYCYQNAQGVPLSTFKAVKLYRLAAEQNYSIAQSNLGYWLTYFIDFAQIILFLSLQ